MASEHLNSHPQESSIFKNGECDLSDVSSSELEIDDLLIKDDVENGSSDVTANTMSSFEIVEAIQRSRQITHDATAVREGFKLHVDL